MTEHNGRTAIVLRNIAHQAFADGQCFQDERLLVAAKLLYRSAFVQGCILEDCRKAWELIREAYDQARCGSGQQADMTWLIGAIAEADALSFLRPELPYWARGQDMQRPDPCEIPARSTA